MKKILMILLCALMLMGCGHKSDSEIVDIGQFKCQDSIETVFSVLGKAELETSGVEGERYKFEELNLYGYEGTAVFKVRDDEDTISSFYCSFILDKAEFENVLDQLSEKYGEYKKSEHSNQIAYVWEIPDSEAEELGYDRISFSDYGDKKAIVDFSDEWSSYKDETYYEHLEKEDKSEVLSKEVYNIGEDEFTFGLTKNEDGYSFVVLCEVEDKSDAFSVHTALNSIFDSKDKNLKILVDDLGFSYTISIGDGATLIRTKSVLTIMKDGKTVSVENYFSPDWIANKSRDSYYGTQVIGFVGDFLEAIKNVKGAE